MFIKVTCKGQKRKFKLPETSSYADLQRELIRCFGEGSVSQSVRYTDDTGEDILITDDIEWSIFLEEATIKGLSTADIMLGDPVVTRLFPGDEETILMESSVFLPVEQGSHRQESYTSILTSKDSEVRGGQVKKDTVDLDQSISSLLAHVEPEMRDEFQKMLAEKLSLKKKAKGEIIEVKESKPAILAPEMIPNIYSWFLPEKKPTGAALLTLETTKQTDKSDHKLPAFVKLPDTVLNQAEDATKVAIEFMHHKHQHKATPETSPKAQPTKVEHLSESLHHNPYTQQVEPITSRGQETSQHLSCFTCSKVITGVYYRSLKIEDFILCEECEKTCLDTEPLIKLNNTLHMSLIPKLTQNFSKLKSLFKEENDSPSTQPTSLLKKPLPDKTQ